MYFIKMGALIGRLCRNKIQVPNQGGGLVGCDIEVPLQTFRKFTKMFVATKSAGSEGSRVTGLTTKISLNVKMFHIHHFTCFYVFSK